MENPIEHQEQLAAEPKHSNSFATFCALCIVFSLVALGGSLWLYRVSGAAQLDLSRPGYQPEETPAAETAPTAEKPFPAAGPLNGSAVSEFLKLYDKKASSVSSSDPFQPSPLSNESLGISE